jgi:single-strand DNA-binding protein
VNTMIVVGNVGKEPEMTYTPNGTAVTKFSIADNLPKKPNQDKPETQWFNCTAFGKTAETLNEHVKKGAKLYLQGSFHARPWTGNDGVAHISLDFTVEKFQFLDSKPNGQPAPGAPTSAADDGESFPF